MANVYSSIDVELCLLNYPEIFDVRAFILSEQGG